jgi:hypothetical protein
MKHPDHLSGDTQNHDYRTWMFYITTEKQILDT